MLYQTNIKDTGQNFSLYPIAVPPLHGGKTSLQLFSFFVAEPTRSLHHCKDAYLAGEQSVREVISHLPRLTLLSQPAIQPLSKLTKHLVAWESEKRLP